MHRERHKEGGLYTLTTEAWTEEYNYEWLSKSDPYELTFPSLYINASFENVTAHRDGPTAEVTFMFSGINRGQATTTSKLSLISPASRKSLASACAESQPELDWAKIVAITSQVVLNSFKRGDEEEVLDTDTVQQQAEGKSWMIYPFLEPDNMTILYGPGSGGKSMLALYLSVLASEGLSVQGVVIDRELKVLVLDWETSRAEIADRIRAIRSGLDLPSEIKNPIIYKRMDAPLSASAPEIKKLIRKYDVDICVIDSVGYASDGDIESSTAAKSFHNTLRSIKTTALVIAHVTKEAASQGGNSVSKPYGSVFYENAARHTFELKKSQNEGGSLLEIGMYDRKANNTGKLRPIGWSMDFTGDSNRLESVRLKAIDIRDSQLADTLHISDQIEEQLKKGPMTSQELADLLEKTSGHISKELSKHKGRFTSVGGKQWANASRREDNNLGDI
tara:strand:- start:856 stop:2199 length:1344 start_codon:yes stop_codon:yes gene_type:complete